MSGKTGHDQTRLRICADFFPYHLWLSMYTRYVTERKSVLDPNDRHGSETVVLVMIQIYLFRSENNVLLMLIDNKCARNGC